jgi:hypothetical protein
MEHRVKEASHVMALDAGHLSIRSRTVDLKTKEELKSKAGQDLSIDDYKTLVDMLYDRYICELTSVQV